MKFNKISAINIKDKRVFIRTDMNVPIVDSRITDDTRIISGLTTIRYALSHGAKVILATHLGRPKEGTCLDKDSVDVIRQTIEHMLQQKIPLIKHLDDKIDFTKVNLVMLENVRCNIGEKANDESLAQKYAALCDVFVHDAFATSHRAEASTDAIAKYVKVVAAGSLMSTEIEALQKVVQSPKSPVVAIVGGSKISTKLSILDNLADKVDYLVVGGGILNTFLLAKGFNVANSLVEVDLVPEAKRIMQKMQRRGAEVPLPDTVIVSKEISESAISEEKPITNLDNDDIILDVGTKFANDLAHVITKSQTVIWNGPLGVFEFEQFANGTRILAVAIGKSKAFSLAGGGDTIAAINKFNLFNQISYVSTAGGALLEFLEGKPLPAITMLEKNCIHKTL